MKNAKMSVKLGGSFGVLILIALIVGVIGYGSIRTMSHGADITRQTNIAATFAMEAAENIQIYLRNETPEQAKTTLELLSRSEDELTSLRQNADNDAQRQILNVAIDEVKATKQGFQTYTQGVAERNALFDTLIKLGLESRQSSQQIRAALNSTIAEQLRTTSDSAQINRFLHMLSIEAGIVESINRVHFLVREFIINGDTRSIGSAHRLIEGEILVRLNEISRWMQQNRVEQKAQENVDHSLTIMQQYIKALNAWVAKAESLNQQYEVIREDLRDVNAAISQAIAAGDTAMENETSKAERIIQLGVAIAVAIGIFLAITITRMIVTPLRQSVNFADAVAQGDLSQTLALTQRDEVGQLVRALNAMVASLRETVSEIQESATGVASASEELSSASVQMSSGMGLQSERVSQIASASLEMSQTSTEIARNMNNIQENTTDALNLSREGGVKVKQSAQEMVTIANEVEGASGHAHALEEKAGRVQEVIQVINDIADQTNLLALNAAIEAARAGDAGRGFAVVADEVRKLAERSAASADEISAIVQSIQGGVDQVVQAMAQVNNRAQIGNRLAQETDSAFAEIIGGMENLQELIVQNAAAIEEMSSTADQITEDIQAISSASEQTAKSSEEVSRASSDLAMLATNVQESVSIFCLEGKQAHVRQISQ
ncbi:HAMP domain-containing methyl-accepting chemotaxis protein [Chrysiogenes arsenatis]|uniref:HAMP domain-containing methyl-accepting chemotaxis protein n=1 Tax=Chrysiogenes arsenatis TaxID=309797 RepID=UPI0004158B69|nr:methyl-accepting chemotaxis protein [Chrysiogenes arsenatis]